MLEVEEGPEHQDQCIEDCYSSIEGKLGDLGSRELAIGIAELDQSLIFVRRELVG